MSNRAPTSASLSLRAIFDTVVAGGYCIGCGACTLGREDYPVEMALDEFGCFGPRAAVAEEGDAAGALPTVCPFAANAPSEDAIAGEFFAGHCRHHHEIGYYAGNYAGYVAEGDFREHGSSGGMATWIVCEAIRRGLVDAVLHVQPRNPDAGDPRLFQYAVSTGAEEAAAGAKSRYYPVEMSGVLRFVRSHPGRYALVGVPCFVKALRLLARHEPLFAERVRFCIALFCGHLKSTAFADFLAWQCGIEPGNLLRIDFRRKLGGREALDYAVQVEGRHGGAAVVRQARVRELYATNWGLGLFKVKACDYCDDVVGETADVSVGDAWLPQYVQDSRGTNVVIVRSAAIHTIVRQGIAEKRLVLEELDPDSVAASQRGGFRHRRQGLAYRLHLLRRAGGWVPPKRVEPSRDWCDRRYRRIIRLRMKLAELSHPAWRKAVGSRTFSAFRGAIDPWVRRYRACYGQSPLRVLAERMLAPLRLAKRIACFPVKRVFGRTGPRRSLVREPPQPAPADKSPPTTRDPG